MKIPICNECNIRECKKKSKKRWRKDGTPTFETNCNTCKDIKSRKPYRKYLTNKCALCPFVAEHECQMDVDHIDGDHSNNDPANLQTLCACCHRLKTYKNKESTNKRYLIVDEYNILC